MTFKLKKRANFIILSDGSFVYNNSYSFYSNQMVYKNNDFIMHGKFKLNDIKSREFLSKNLSYIKTLNLYKNA